MTHLAAAQPDRRPGAGVAQAMVIWFLMAMTAAQTLGLLHGILHRAGISVASAPVASLSHATANNRIVTDNYDHAAAGLLSQLFSDHLRDTDCRTYDQLSHFDAAPSCGALALPLVLTPFIFAILPGLATARWLGVLHRGNAT